MAANQQSLTGLPPNTMTTEDVAARVDLEASSIRVMMWRARINRERGRVRPTDMPAPDFTVFRSPLWKSESIEKWVKAREANNLGGTPKGASAAKTARNAEPKKSRTAGKPSARKHPVSAK